MLRFYHVYDLLCHNNSEVASNCGILVSDKEKSEIIRNITWDNLAEMMSIDAVNQYINVKNKPKGRVVCFSLIETFPFGDYAPVKEWRTPDLNIVLKTVFKEYTPTLREIFEWHDLKTACQYLAERGFICDVKLLSGLQRD